MNDSTTLAADNASFEKATFDKVAAKLIPFLFVCYIVAFLDRVNVGFAKLQMAGDLNFSDAIYGFGAGIFFIGYFIFEVPSNIILEKVGARRWIPHHDHMGHCVFGVHVHRRHLLGPIGRHVQLH